MHACVHACKAPDHLEDGEPPNKCHPVRCLPHPSGVECDACTEQDEKARPFITHALVHTPLHVLLARERACVHARRICNMVYRSAPPAVGQKRTDRGPWWQRWPPRSRPLRSPVHTHARCQHALARAGTHAHAHAHAHASTGGTSFTAATTCTLALDGTSISSFCWGPTRIDKSARGLLSLGAPPARGMHPIRRAVRDAPSRANTAAASTRARTRAETNTSRRVLAVVDIRADAHFAWPASRRGSVRSHATRIARTTWRIINMRFTRTWHERRSKSIRCCEPCEHERPLHRGHFLQSPVPSCGRREKRPAFECDLTVGKRGLLHSKQKNKQLFFSNKL